MSGLIPSVPALSYQYSGGREVAYAERTTILSNQTNDAYADSGLTLPDFTVGTRPVYIELVITQLQSAVSAAPLFALTTSTGTVISDITIFHGISFGSLAVQVLMKRYAPGTGLLSGLKIQHKAPGATNDTFSWVMPTTGGVSARLIATER